MAKKDYEGRRKIEYELENFLNAGGQAAAAQATPTPAPVPVQATPVQAAPAPTPAPAPVQAAPAPTPAPAPVQVTPVQAAPAPTPAPAPVQVAPAPAPAPAPADVLVPGLGYEFWHAESRSWGLTKDIWKAKQISNDVYNIVWVMYRGNIVVRKLTDEELIKYAP